MAKGESKMQNSQLNIYTGWYVQRPPGWESGYIRSQRVTAMSHRRNKVYMHNLPEPRGFYSLLMRFRRLADYIFHYKPLKNGQYLSHFLFQIEGWFWISIINFPSKSIFIKIYAIDKTSATGRPEMKPLESQKSRGSVRLYTAGRIAVTRLQ